MSRTLQGWKQRWQLTYAGWQIQSLARASFWVDKFNQRFSRLGLLFISAILVTLVFGVNIKKTMIYQLFTLLLCLFVLAVVVTIIQSFRQKKQWQVSRSMSSYATVGSPFSYQLQLNNITDSDLYHLRVAERTRPVFPSRHQFMTMAEPDEEKRNYYDRKMGYYRFAWLVQWLRGAVLNAEFLAKVEAGKRIHVEMNFIPLRRGYMHLDRIRISIGEPLGLIYRFEDYELPQSLLVLPKRYAVPTLLTHAGKHSFQKEGLALASNVGEPEEFYRMREYRVGDSPRHVHWPSLARAGKPLVKEYQDENFARQALVLDNFADERKSQLFEEAVSLAAGFAMAVESDDALLDLMFVADHQHVEDLVVGRALAHGEQMLEALATIETCREGDFDVLKQMIIAQSDRFGSCIVVLLEWDEKRSALVHQLLSLAISVRVFLIQQEGETLQQPIGEVEHFHILHQITPSDGR